MRKIVTTFVLGLALVASPALAHHPAADMVDADIYAMIDELVSDTPHATLVFDDSMGMNDTTTITVPSVSDAEDLIADYLLATLSLLDEDVTVSITFGEDVETDAESSSVQSDKWIERDDWGRQVIITVDTLLCVEGNCVDIGFETP
jgi:hypothetical protein